MSSASISSLLLGRLFFYLPMILFACLLVISSSVAALEVPLGGKPQAVAINSGTNQALVAIKESQALQVIDLATNNVVATIALGEKPTNIALNLATGMAVVTHEKSDSVSFVDLATNIVLGTLAVGEDPYGVAVDLTNNLAIVSNKKSDTVSIIDLQIFAVINVLAVGEKPEDVAIDDDIAIVSNEKSDTLSFIDLVTQTVVATVHTAESPGAVAINAQTQIAVIAHKKLNQISIVDIPTRTVLGSLSAGEEPRGVAINPVTNRALVSNENDDSVSVIDLGDLSMLGMFSVGRNPVGIAINATSNIAVVANEKGQSISIIDLATATYAVSAPVGRDPRGIGIHPVMNIAVVANKKDDTVSILSLPDGNATATVAVGKKPHRVAIHTQRKEAFVTQRKDDMLTVIDLASNQVVAAIPVGKDPHGLVVDESTGTVIVTNKKDNSLSVIDLNTRTVTATIPVGKDPVDAALHPALNSVLVVNKKDDTLQIIDLQSDTVTATIATGRKPLAVTVSTTLNMAVVANEKDDSLTLIDLSNNSFIVTIPVGKEPRGLSVLDDAGLAFVVNEGDDTLSVVDLTTQAVIDTLSVGREPFAMAVHPDTYQGAVTNEKSGDVTLLDFASFVSVPLEVIASPSLPANAGGWHKQDVIITYTCSGGEGGVASCPASVTHSTEGVGQVISATATDVAGNTASASVLLNLDKTQPTVTATSTPLANIYGWHNSDVIVSFNCSDTLSGVVQCPADLLVSDDGAGQVVNVTDLAGNSAVSAITLMIDKIAPIVTINSPLEGAVLTEAPVTINGNVVDANTITSLEINGVAFTATTDGSFSGAIPLLSGANTLTATAIDIADNSGSAAVNVIYNQLPVITSVPVTAATENSLYSYDVNANDPDVGDVLTYSLINSPAGMSIDSVSGLIQWAPTAADIGDHNIMVRVADQLSAEVAQEYIVTVTEANSGGLGVVISTPAEGATIGSSSVLVSGVFQGLSNIGITVNEVVALISGDKFYANNVSLAVGDNLITVTATTLDGDVVTQSLTVTRTGASLVEVTASPQSGIAPLNTAFSITNNTGQSIQQISVDFDGDGNIDFVTTDNTAPIEFLYTTVGAYQVNITVIDDLNVSYDQTLMIVVQSGQELDQLLTELWRGMNDALVLGDINSAVQFMNSSARQKYEPVFDVLRPYMPGIIASYSPMSRVSISGNIGGYAITRVVNGQKKLFLIYFLKDADGVWRLDTM